MATNEILDNICFISLSLFAPGCPRSRTHTPYSTILKVQTKHRQSHVNAGTVPSTRNAGTQGRHVAGFIKAELRYTGGSCCELLLPSSCIVSYFKLMLSEVLSAVVFFYKCCHKCHFKCHLKCCLKRWVNWCVKCCLRCCLMSEVLLSQMLLQVL